MVHSSTPRVTAAASLGNCSVSRACSASCSLFHAVTFGWLFFRAKSLGDALTILDRLATFSGFHPNLDPRLLAVLAAGLVSHYGPESWYQRALGMFASLPALAQAGLLLLLALSVREMASLEAVPFVYFQF